MDATPPRDGKEAELYEQLWSRPYLTDVVVPGHRPIAVTSAELEMLSEDPRWQNVNRFQEALKRTLPKDSGFYGTLGDLAVFVRG